MIIAITPHIITVYLNNIRIICTRHSQLSLSAQVGTVEWNE